MDRIAFAFSALEEDARRAGINNRPDLQPFNICITDTGQTWSFDPRRRQLFKPEARDNASFQLYLPASALYQAALNLVRTHHRGELEYLADLGCPGVLAKALVSPQMPPTRMVAPQPWGLEPSSAGHL